MFTKAQMIERIKRTAEQQNENTKQAVEHINLMNDPEIQVLSEVVLTTGTGIIDMLVNLTLVLCEMLPKED